MSGEKEVKRGRIYAVVRSYSYDSNAKGILPNISEADWKKDVEETIQNAYATGAIEYMAYIYHDRDKDAQGGIAPIHCHIMVRFHQVYAQDVVATMFKASTRGQSCDPSRNNLGTAQYLVHISVAALRDEKTIYGFDEVICINCRYRDLVKDTFWKKIENNDSENTKVSKNQAEVIFFQAEDGIRDGKLRVEEAIEQLEEQAGYDWVRTYRHTFEADRLAFFERRVKELAEDGRDLFNIYIMGAGSIGKSYLARALALRLADGKGLYPAAVTGAGKTPDPMNSYIDQMVAVFNEMSPHGWGLEEFLNCFDRYIYAQFPSRNENRDYIGHSCIFTNSISPLAFSKDLMIYSKGGSQYQDPGNKRDIDGESKDALDKYWQVRRRFQTFMVLLRDEANPEIVNGYVFNLRKGIYQDGVLNNEDGTHVLVGHITYTFMSSGEPEITDEALDELLRLMKVDVSEDFASSEIDDFLEIHGLVEVRKDALLDDFIDRFINECVWDLLPFDFIYDGYRSFRSKFYPNDELVNQRELNNMLEYVLTDWERTKSAVTSSGRTDKQESLIYEYRLENWGYVKSQLQAFPSFSHKAKYRGFLRK